MTKASINGILLSYTYNVNGFRKSKAVNGNTIGFVWNGSNLVAETNGANIVNIYNYGIDGILMCDMNGNKSYYLKNAHGDVEGTTGTDGNITNQYKFDAFGKPLGTQNDSTNPFGYCGEYTDLDTNLVYLRNRYYDSSVGRFISEDPARAQTNWYIYGNNNPIMFIDPMGTDAIVLTNANSVDLPVLGKQGHTSAVYQDADGAWYYTYWGDKAAAVIRIPDKYTISSKNGNVTTSWTMNSMDSLGNFNESLNKFLSDYGYENITSDYTDSTYIVGDFTASLDAAYDDVYEAINSGSDGYYDELDDGSVVLQGKNGSYFVGNDNCFDRTYASLSKGTLANGMNAGTYMKDLGESVEKVKEIAN